MSIKKLLSYFVIFTFLFTSFSSANVKFVSWWIEVLEETNTETKLTATVDGIWSEIKWINARFCNNWLESLTEKITSNLWQMDMWEICVVVKNDSEKDAKVNLSFSDQSITKAWNVACDRSWKSTFAWFIDIPDTQLSVPAWDYVTKTFKIQFPLWVDWKQWGCLFYNAERDTAWEQMINIVVWKALFLDYFVWELWEIQNTLELKIIDKKIVNNELIVNVWAKNKWNIDLKTDISWSLTNMFGINKNFSITWEIVRINNSLVFSLNFGQLPNYKWLYNMTISAKHAPHFDFDVSKFDVDPSIFAEKETKINTTYFEMPRIVLWTVLVIIILLILAFRKPKQKVIYVEKK